MPPNLVAQCSASGLLWHGGVPQDDEGVTQDDCNLNIVAFEKKKLLLFEI